jgi:hypothetical protein
MMLRFLSMLLACAATALSQSGPFLKEDTFRGQPAWALSNGLIRVTVMAQGGHLAEIRLISADSKVGLNPMLTPPEGEIPRSYMGHLLCFPSYGPASPDERAAGLTGHGEAGVVEWKKAKGEIAGEAVILRYTAELPKTQYRVERVIRIPAGMLMVKVEESVENLAPFDRPINWMEHATVGPPFAEPGKTVLDMSATRGQVTTGRRENPSLQPGSAVEWPRGSDYNGAPADLRVFQPRPNAATYYGMRLDPSRAEQFFTLYHPSYRVLLGYTFPSAGNPWIADYQGNTSARVARGIEFGSSPFDEGLRKSVERATLFDMPTYRWISAKQRLKAEFTIFLMEIPEGFAGVKDARIENGEVRVIPR